MSGFVGNGPSGMGRAARFQFAATAAQTTFSGVDQNGLTLAYTPGYVEVILNGVWLPPSDYTAGDGSSIVFGSGLAATDVVYIYALSVFSAADTFSKAQNGADIQSIKAFLANISAWDPGDCKLTFRTVPRTGWFFCDDGSIGNVASSATTRANADTSDCFAALYDISALVVQDSNGTPVARGVSAVADYAANRRLVIPKMLGRSIAIAGAGSGMTARLLGANAGAETETPTIAKTASHDHQSPTDPGGAYTPGGSVYGVVYPGTGAYRTSLTGGGNPLNILDPSIYLNIAMKL